jgi:hypothetical protein
MNVTSRKEFLFSVLGQGLELVAASISPTATVPWRVRLQRDPYRDARRIRAVAPRARLGLPRNLHI